MIKTLFFILLLLFVSSALFIGQTLYQSDNEQGISRDIYNLTKDIEVNYSCDYLYENDAIITVPDLKIKRLNNIVCSFSEFLIISTLETMKFGVEFGYNNPQYDYNVIIKLVKLWFYALLIALIVPILIPLIALITLLFIGLKNIYNYTKIYLEKNHGDKKNE